PFLSSLAGTLYHGLLSFAFQYGEYPLTIFLFPAAFFFATAAPVPLPGFSMPVLFDNIPVLFSGLLLIFLPFQHCFAAIMLTGFHNRQQFFCGDFLPVLFVIAFYHFHFSATDPF